jgi:hypothetical protein
MPHDLRGTTLKDLMCEITMRVIENDRNGLAAVRCVVALAERMASSLSLENRFRISEQMRDVADGLERRAIVRVD